MTAAFTLVWMTRMCETLKDISEYMSGGLKWWDYASFSYLVSSCLLVELRSMWHFFMRSVAEGQNYKLPQRKRWAVYCSQCSRLDCCALCSATKVGRNEKINQRCFLAGVFTHRLPVHWLRQQPKWDLDHHMRPDCQRWMYSKVVPTVIQSWISNCSCYT